MELAKGQTTGGVCRKLGITEQTYYRWRKEYGSLRVDQVRRLKELERENGRLKKSDPAVTAGFRSAPPGCNGVWTNMEGGPITGGRSPVYFCVVHVVVAGAFAWAYSHTAIPGHMFSGLDDSIIT